MTPRRAATAVPVVLLCGLLAAPAGVPALAVPGDPGAPGSPAPTPSRTANAPSPAPSQTASPSPTASQTASQTASPSPAPSQTSNPRVAQAISRQEALERDVRDAQERIDAVFASAELATERYNEARVALGRSVRAAQRAVREAASAQGRSAQERARVDDLAVQIYMQGGSLEDFGPLVGLTRLARGSDVARDLADLEAVGTFRAQSLEQARAAAAKAQAAGRAAAQATLVQKAAAARSRQAFDAANAAVAAAQAEQDALSARREAVLTELARLRNTSTEQERERIDAVVAREAVRAAQAKAGGIRVGTVPAPDRASAAQAIAYARRQLGKPYLWAAEGPDSFDCSGLTMRAWESAGRPLVHFSGAQYAQTARVPLAALQPGDLVFFGDDPAAIHHVGLYVGDGRMIEAPRSGLAVRYSTIHRSGLLPYGGRL